MKMFASEKWNPEEKAWFWKLNEWTEGKKED